MQRRISFSGVLLVTLLVTTLGGMALVTYLSFEVHEQSIQEMSQQVVQQSLQRVTDRLDELVRVTTEHEDLFAKLAPEGALTSADFPDIFQQLWTTVEPHRQISYFGVGITDTGEYAMLRRLPDHSLIVRMYVRDAVTGPQIRDYRPSVRGLEPMDAIPWTNSGNPRETYDLKLRPFYQQAAKARRSTWTDSYLFWDGTQQGDIPGITFATPVFDDAGRMALIWDIDLELASLSEFLQRVQSQVTGKLLIVEHRKDGTWKPIAQPKANPREPWPTELVNRFVAGLPAEYALTPQFIQSHPMIEIQGQQWRVAGATLAGPRRPEWLVAEFWPVQNSPRGVVTRQLSFLGAFIGTGVVASIVAWWISSYIAQPLQELDEHARELSAGQRLVMPVIDGPAEIVQLSVTLNQLAERVRERQTALESVNSELIQSNGRLQAHIWRTPVGCVELDEQGRIQRWNPAATEIFGWTEEEVLGSYFDFFVPENIRPQIKDVFERLCQGAGGYQNDNQNVTKAGRIIDCEWFNTPLFDEHGKLFAIACLVNDVTERKRVELELRQLNEHLELRVKDRTSDLQGALRDLETFSYSVAHDLRTPLRAISGFSQALEDDCGGALDDVCRDHLRRIRAATARMGDLIDALLRMARVARQEVSREPVDLAGLVRQAFDQRQQADRKREVQLKTAATAIVNGDRQLLAILIDNLVDNAWKYTRKQPHPVIEFLAETRPDGRWFAVRDNGAGFDARFSDKAVMPFERLHHADEFEGNGIGLATAMRIAQKHGGDLRLENRPEGGAICWFRLDSPSPEA
ncbi:PAS domain S-box protein [bacterium]|nr:PAS domain S-box protein [bacterium]